MDLELLQGEHGLELAHENGNWVLLRDYGYSPVQMLVSSIGACGAYVYRSILERSSIPFELERVFLDYERNDDDKAHPLKKVNVTFKVSIPSEYRDRAQRSLRLVNEYCPVIRSLDPSIEIVKTLVFGE